MAFYGGYGSYGGMYGGNMQQTYEQERVGYGPGGYVFVVVIILFDEPTLISLQVGSQYTGGADQSKSIHWSNVCRNRKRIRTDGWIRIRIWGRLWRQLWL
jgi:hypothetical protein